MKQKVLICFPNTTNKADITTPVLMLAGRARERGWEVSYRDSSSCRKGPDQLEEKESTGGYLPGLTKTQQEMIPAERLLPAPELWGPNTDYSLFEDRCFVHPFDGRMVRMFWMEVARGCPYTCTYCGNSALKKIYRGLGTYVCTRPLDSVFRLLAAMIENHGVEIFNMTDECFLAHPAGWLEAFSRRYAAEIRKPFLIQTRPETVTERTLPLLQACGAPFVQIGMGVESGSERILREVCNRKTRIEDVVRAYDLIHELGFRSNAYFMIGLPTETREEIFQKIELCRRIGAHVNSVSIYQPLPGQPLTDVCLEKGYITGREPLETFASASVLTMPQISAEEIADLRRTFMLYARLPREMFPLIEKCERDFANNQESFARLLKQRWEQDRSYPMIQERS